ncbi:MAG: TM2 domain-containing protein [Myxococcaceae bacterium]
MKFITDLLDSIVREWVQRPKKLGLSYGLCLVSFLGPAGLHRFYLGKPVSGVLYFCTWGFAGLGTLFDLFQMPSLVHNYNQLNPVVTHKALSSERAILTAAKKHQGVLTIPMVSMETSLSLSQAREHLHKLYVSGYCTKDIDQDGVEIYEFIGLEAKKPLWS